VRRWPAPVVDAIEPGAAETAHRYSAWGHRKIWAMLRADGVRVSASSVQRALRRRGLLLPVRYQAERRQLAVRRRAVFVATPVRRNRVWQTDFSEFETAGGGTWRISAVLDYVTKTCLTATVVPTSAARDAIETIGLALAEAEGLLGHPVRDDCCDPATGELSPLAIVSDKRARLQEHRVHALFRCRHELVHVRTRHRAPETNGVVERFFGTLKYEHLYRIEIGDVLELQAEVDAFRQLYNRWRPHEALGFDTPLSHYLAEPTPDPNLSEPESLQET